MRYLLASWRATRLFSIDSKIHEWEKGSGQADAFIRVESHVCSSRSERFSSASDRVSFSRRSDTESRALAKKAEWWWKWSDVISLANGKRMFRDRDNARRSRDSRAISMCWSSDRRWSCEWRERRSVEWTSCVVACVRISMDRQVVRSSASDVRREEPMATTTRSDERERWARRDVSWWDISEKWSSEEEKEMTIVRWRVMWTEGNDWAEHDKEY